MKTVTIHKTKNTPEVIIDYHTDTFTIEGISIPEDAPEFYGHVLQEFKKYKDLKSKVLFVINLTNINSGSVKCLLTLFKEAATYEGSFQKTNVDWLFPKNDTALKESGQIFEHISRLKFNYRENERS